MGWVEKYAPKKLNEIIGQSKAISQFLEWYEKWKPGDKAAMFYGQTGRGKTALVYAFANEKGLDVVEVNASDWRNKDVIEEVLGRASKQMSLFRRGKIILVDEVDGIAGREDRGGVGALIKVIKESKFPIVLTANDPYDKKLAQLRQYVKLIEFGKVHMNSIVAKLKEICKKEGIECDDSVLKQIARSSGGDVRSAINDLETLAMGRKKIEKEDIHVLGYREQEQNIFEALKVIFKTMNVRTAVGIIENVDRDPEEIFWWIEENIPKEYEKKEEVAEAFDMLSRADLFRSKIQRMQNWRFRKYMIDLMCGGVALSKKEPYHKFTKYSYPQRLSQYGRTKVLRKDMDEMCRRIGEKLHTSTKVVKRDYLPLFKVMLKNSDWREILIKDFSLSDEEVGLIERY